MNIEKTRTTAEAASSRELNKYLDQGWVLILSYVRHAHDTQEPRFVVGWQQDADPVRPELLDEWELNELDRQKFR
ncbi:MAG: hypothetical protein ABIO91_02715 [Pyrinomonadaceae bacterium]